MNRWYDKFIAFDTETTGFGKNARILELAILTYENGVCTDRWSTLFNPPDVDWNNPDVQKALSINKITREDLEGCPTFHDYLDVITNLLNSTNNWCAHNLPFDVRMLQQEFEREGCLFGYQYRSMDTMILDVIHNPCTKGRKLFEVADRWGVVLDDAHTAEADTQCCGDIFVKMAECTDMSDAELFDELVTKRRKGWDDSFKKR